MKKIASIVVGIFLVILGIIGWLLPIVPGWPLILIGASLIVPDFAKQLKRRLFRKFFNKDIVILDNLKKYRVQAGFTTRRFPVVLKKTDDLLDENNQRYFHEAISVGAGLPSTGGSVSGGKPAPTRYVFLNQVHGDALQVLEDENQLASVGAGLKPAPTAFYHLMNTDSVVTNLSNLVLLVLTADCLPVFFIAGRDDGRWIGLVHAGWRGTQKRIVRKAFDMIREKSGCGVSDIRVVFGPHIGKDHYEVGEEFMDHFGHVGARGRAPLRRTNGKLYFDLTGETKRQLLEAGALKSRITDLDLCTVCDPKNFYSFRLEKGNAGRLVSFIGIF